MDLRFLGTSLTFMMVYVWGRRNAHVTLSFLGVFNFTAPYLPWVLLGFSVVLRSSPVVDLLGMAVGRRTLLTAMSTREVVSAFLTADNAQPSG